MERYKFLYRGVVILLNPGTHTALFYNEYQGITGISVLVTPYVPNQHQLAGIYSYWGEVVKPLHVTLNILEKSTEELNSISDLIPLQSYVRREDITGWKQQFKWQKRTERATWRKWRTTSTWRLPNIGINK